MSAEHERLEACRREAVPWRRWGPYLSERQWGTVREDYSPDGSAWESFPHDHARSRAYRWGEDGIAGWSDDQQRLCFALALWNGKDPILKERMFGLANGEGNHGEDVKEYWFYLDGTPTHSYMRCLYKYPQRAFPYADLVETNRARTRTELEYELLDTGVFADDRYFDVEVEYAKASPEDTLVRITAHNRGPDAAVLHLLPTLWFRNTWSHRPDAERPLLWDAAGVVIAEHPALGTMHLHVEDVATLVFTENETNTARLGGRPNATPWVKDAFHTWLVDGRPGAVNPGRRGTKAAAHRRAEVPAGGTMVMRLRLRRPDATDPFADFDASVATRRAEADAFHDTLAPAALGEDGRRVLRQSVAGMLWGKQYYYFDVDQWLREHGASPSLPRRLGQRNGDWFHMLNDDVISMPDKWEYPWYAAWDLAFHAVALAPVDVDFAKSQLTLMLRELYLHPNGQMPAYEWNFGDVNPPVHAWAVYHVWAMERAMRGTGDHAFLRDAFHKLLVNFTWWVNRKDPTGRNVFEGGFLGLDNIGVFDRSKPLPTGGHLEQADGTAWMALFCQSMLQIALELAADDPLYEDLALKFVEHFLWIAAAMDRMGEAHDDLWDDEDGFFYDLLRLPDGTAMRLKVRSLVGLLPLCATTVFPAGLETRFPNLLARIRRFLARRPEVTEGIAPLAPGLGGRRMLGILGPDKLRRVLARLLDEDEFLSPHGIRALSRHHLRHPFVFVAGGEEHRVAYEPAESTSGLFGGNSNWRGPVWMPMNLLIVRALVQLYAYHGDDFRVECPTGSGRMCTLYEVAMEVVRRLNGIFLRGADGRRPVFGGAEKFQADPYWRDHLLFYEYFHGDDGAGIGASHQTGWTGLVGRLIALSADMTPEAARSHEGVVAVVRPALPGRA
ncbi:MAG: glucosidase [bacterium]|nr:glucosidase [bacterium]